MKNRLANVVIGGLLLSIATTPMVSLAESASNVSANIMEEPPLLRDNTTTYISCYFGTVGSNTWRWGLNNDKRKTYFVMNGEYKKTPFTRNEKFFTAITKSSVDNACATSKSYYNIKQPYIAGFAANSSAGYNYPIVTVNGSTYTELYPQW